MADKIHRVGLSRPLSAAYKGSLKFSAYSTQQPFERYIQAQVKDLYRKQDAGAWLLCGGMVLTVGAHALGFLQNSKLGLAALAILTGVIGQVVLGNKADKTIQQLQASLN